MLLSQITFGVELEYAGLTRFDATMAVVAALESFGLYQSHNAFYPFTVTMTDGRVWRIVTDGSVRSGCEAVSPICTTEDNDIAVIQEVMRRLVAAGGRCGPGSGAGLHMHIGMQNWSDKQFHNLMKFMRKYERVLVSMVGTTDRREHQWCSPMQATVEAAVLDGRSRIDCARAQRGRYVGVNLASLFSHGTVEMRFLEAVRHAGKLRAQMELILNVAKYCANAKRTCAKQRETNGNTKYAARVLMKQVGMVGPEFKTVRKHLLANLDGDSVLNRTAHHGYESWAVGRVAGEPRFRVEGRAPRRPGAL